MQRAVRTVMPRPTRHFRTHPAAWLLSFSLLAYSCTQRPAEPPHPSSFKLAEDFALLDEMGHFHRLYYFTDKKAVVLVSQQNGCPINRKSYGYLEGLKKIYGPLGVVFLMINANPQDDRPSIRQEAKDYGLDIPILQDRAQVIAEGLSIKRSAEALVIDPSGWSIVYQGAISDEFGYETQFAGPIHPYLKNAIDAVMSHKPVAVPHTDIKGCLFDFTARPAQPVTYGHDVAPILMKKCILCHSQGQIAPWSMDDYGKVMGHGAMIREVIRTRRMPPWGADSSYLRLKNDLSLTPQQTRTMVHWVEQGMPRGDGPDPLPSAQRPAVDGWPWGRPDMIISCKDLQTIPPTGNLNYRFVPGDKVMDQDRWIKMSYWNPGNRKVLHHAHLLVENPALDRHQEWFYASGRYFDFDMVPRKKNYHLIDNYSPGYSPLLLPSDTGMYLPKGTRFTFVLHYTPTGKAETDQTRIGLYFHKTQPAKILSIYYFWNKSKSLKAIPAHVKNFIVRAVLPIPNQIRIYGIKPHMHLRGRSMTITAHYPDGNSHIILSVPNYKYNWQARYLFTNPLLIPAGTKMEIVSTYDNSAQNPDNPDPDHPVLWGGRTNDEMQLAIFYYVRETSFEAPKLKNYEKQDLGQQEGQSYAPDSAQDPLDFGGMAE